MSSLRSLPSLALAILACAVLLVHVPSAAAGTIVWAKNPGEAGSAPAWGEIWTARDDGSGARPLIRPNGHLPGIRPPWSALRLGSPRLAADGRTLTFTATWNRVVRNGQATACGVFCEGVYQLKGGVLRRLSPATDAMAISGCTGGTASMCESFEGPVAPLGTSVLFLSRVDTWVGCPLTGCPAVATSDQSTLAAYTPRGTGFARSTLFDWNATSADHGCNGEPSALAFDANPNGLVFTECYRLGLGTDVAITDLTTVAPIARFATPPMHLALNAAGTRVLAAASAPSDSDPIATWAFSSETAASAKTPADYTIALYNEGPWSFLGAAWAGEAIIAAASDGNVYRFPPGCGSTTSCHPADRIAITTDARATLYPGSGDPFFAGRHAFNSAPSWTAATSLRLGGSTSSPHLTTIALDCVGTPCRATATWIASTAGRVQLTISRAGRRLGSASLSTAVGPNGGSLPARIGGQALRRGATYRVSAVLVAGGHRSRPTVATIHLR